MFWIIFYWLSTVLALVGIYLLNAKEKRSGLAVGIVGCAMWVVVGIHSDILEVSVINAVILVMDVFGYINFEKNQNKRCNACSYKTQSVKEAE
jgi:hypothetical protein